MTEAATLPQYIVSLHESFSTNDNRTDWWLLQYAERRPDLGLKRFPNGNLQSFELTPELLGKLAPLYLASAFEWAKSNLQPNKERDIIGLLGSLACALPYADRKTQDDAFDFVNTFYNHTRFSVSGEIHSPGFFTLAASVYALPDTSSDWRDRLLEAIIKPVADRVLSSLSSPMRRDYSDEFNDFGDGFIFLMAKPQPQDVAWVTETFIGLYDKSPDPSSDEPIYSAYFLNEAHPEFILALTPVVSADLIPDQIGFSLDVITAVFARLKELAAESKDRGEYIPFADNVMKWVGTESLGNLADVKDEFLEAEETPLARLYEAMPADKKPEFSAAIRSKITALGEDKRKELFGIPALSSWLDAPERSGVSQEQLAAYHVLVRASTQGASAGGGGSMPANVKLFHCALQNARGM